jgi:formylmethanofuran--tetrahydromethanopterin N-formyltransferase
VIDGINEQAVGDAMTSGIQAAIGPELLAVSAGNYGGTLGKFRFHLHQLLTTA